MEKTICIFGASSTWGAWDSEKGGWVNRLRLFLETKYDVFVYNCGVSGDTTEELLERFDAESKARAPNVIIISIGDNDSIYIGSKKKNMVSIKSFENNLNKLIKKSKKLTSDIVLIGCKKVDESKTNPIPWERDYYYKNNLLMEYDRKIKEAADKNKVFYLNVFDVLGPKDMEDGLHANAKGHEKFFMKVKEFIIDKKLL